MKFRKNVTALFLFIFIVCSSQLAAGEYFQIPGVVQVHSTVGYGLYSIEELVALAREMGLEVLIMTDQDHVAMEYGAFPFRSLFKKRIESKSVLKLGPEKYLSLISQVNQRQKDVLVVPGVQSSPFYYWTGSPLKENLTAHNFRKELLLIGMMSADDYRDLPLLYRGFSTRYFKKLLPQSIVFLLSLSLGIYLIFQHGNLKVLGVIIGLLSTVLLINDHPFQSSRFDAYHGDQGIAPYQDLIDYVNGRGGFTFWAHPESNYSKSETKLGPVKAMTIPYADSLLEARDYTGFSVIYGDSGTAAATDPGKHWDQLLNEYCSGQRSHPVWGIAGADFYGEAAGEKLDRFQTIFLTKSKSTLPIIDALSNGRVYAKRKEKGGGLTLSDFLVEDAGTGKTAIMGAELTVSSYPVIRANITSDSQVQHAVKVLLIKGGSILHQLEGETPLAFAFDDKAPWVGKSYFRLEVHSVSAGELLSNPIFVDRMIALDFRPEPSRIPKENAADKTTIVEKSTASDKVIKIESGKEPLTQPLGFEAEKQVKAELTDAQGPVDKPSDSELKITAISVPYSAQVASLTSLELAQKALQDYHRSNLPAFHVKVNLGDKGIWWRLYVGYFATQKEAMAARKTYHLPESIVKKTPYANLVGVYASLEETSAIRQRLERMEYSPYIVRKSTDSYNLYVGAFVTLKGAKDLQRDLKINGIATEVVKR